MAGFENDVMLATNVNFDTTAPKPHTGIITADGQLLIGASSTPFLRANTLTQGSGISIANGPGTITISTTGTGFTWEDKSVSYTAEVEKGYFINAALTALLPAAPTNGESVAFIVDVGSVLTIQANGGQAIRMGSTISQVNGTAKSTARGDSVELVYHSTGAVWINLSGATGGWNLT